MSGLSVLQQRANQGNNRASMAVIDDEFLGHQPLDLRKHQDPELFFHGGFNRISISFRFLP